jgi:tRNA-specific 2-thiouridylase
MSGGVDSSVAAALLVKQGYDAVGVTMKLFDDGHDLPDRPCCSLDSTSDARRVCEKLGIPHYVVNMVDHFSRDVIKDFVAEYARGRTPIPCVRCNTFTKFSDLLAKADAIDAPLVATGHYARVENGTLMRGADENKDQTYFLWGIDRAVLPRLVLPVGNMTKVETRAIARELGMTRVADKPESQEICFVPDGDYVKILRRELPADAPALSRGAFVTSSGEVLGEHDGFAQFTIGQRKGLPGGFGEAKFVVALRPETREVVIGSREELLDSTVVVREVNWLVADAPTEGSTVQVRVRHRAPLVEATVTAIAGREITLSLLTPISAIAPGQSLVCYDGVRVLGGGFIESAS